MKTVRRLYFYAVALISLEVVLWGVIGLLRTLVHQLSIGAGNALAQALALVFVGVPIFLVHWLWAQNAAAREEEEQTASLRAAFLYAALFATLVPVVQNLLALINRLFLEVSSISMDRALLGANQTPVDNLIAIGMNLLVAYYFWTVLQKTWRSLPDEENFSEVRRLYRYVWLLYSLSMSVFGVQQVIRFCFNIPTQVVGIVQRSMLVNGLALLAVGLPIWLFIWNLCQKAFQTDPGERNSILRLGMLYLLALGGVLSVLTAAGTFLFQILNQIMGAELGWPDFIQKLGGPLSIGVPLGTVWAYYGHWLDRHIETTAEGTRREALKRPYRYILSLIGLAAAFIGVSLLIRVIIDLALGRQFAGDSFMRERVAGSLATIAVGLPLWIGIWRRAEQQARGGDAAAAEARRSVVRRGYLYLVLFISVIGGMVAAVTLVFRLLSALLTGDNSGDFGTVVLNSLQLLILFAVVLVYHLRTLRQDGASREDEPVRAAGDFPVLVIDPGQGDFAERVRFALGRQGCRIPVSVMAASEQVPAEAHYRAVILSMGTALHPPQGLGAWLEGFDGRKIVVPEAGDKTLLAGDAREVARLAGRLAEGLEVSSGRAAQPGWMIAVYVMAALFALQALFALFAFGLSAILRF